MNKSYSINGVVYNFIDVHEECGVLVGECTTRPHWGQLAWLDPTGVQFFGESRVEATEIVHYETPFPPPGYHYWGGELRNSAEWRRTRGGRY